MSANYDDGNTSSKKILTIPNLLSFFRIILIPVIIWLYYFKQQYTASIIVLLLSGATDLIDGWVARRFNMISDLGKILDPVADKLTQGVTLLCLVSRFSHLLLLLVILLIKESIMAVMGLLMIKKTGAIYGADWHGKMTTALIYTTIGIHIIWYDIPYNISLALMIASLFVMLLSLLLYIIQNIRKSREQVL